MRDVKRIVRTSFWEDETVVNMFSAEDKYFYLYLLTNPHTTQLGIYTFIPKLAAFEMGYSKDSICVLLERFEKKYDMIRYSPDTSEIAIKNFLRHSIVKGGKPVMDCLLKEETSVQDRELLRYIYNNLTSKYIDNDTLKEYIRHLGYVCANDNDNDNDNERIVKNSERVKAMVIAESKRNTRDGKYVCEWCGNKTNKIQKHHFPIPVMLGGTETVKICRNCHEKFHRIEYEERTGVYETNEETKPSARDLQREADAMFESLWKLYPRKKGKGAVKDATKRKLYAIGFDRMKRAVEKFNRDMEGRDIQYVMHGSRFFNSGYVDYLDDENDHVEAHGGEVQVGIDGSILE